MAPISWALGPPWANNGSTRGLIHYNDSNDLIDQKYKLYVVIDDDDMLRIDFTKIYTDASNDNNEKQVQEVPTLVFRGKCPKVDLTLSNLL